MEIDNWRAAIQWALNERGDVVLGQCLVAELVGIAAPLHLGGRSLVLSALELVDEHTPTSIFAKLKHAEAQVAKMFAEFAVQLASSERAITLYRNVGDTVGVATAQTLAGHALASLGRAREAKAMLEEALVLARTSGDRLLVAWILRTLAFTGTIANDLDAIPAYLAEALAIYEATGVKDPVPWALEDLADYAFAAGNPKLALRYATEMLTAARDHNPSPHCVASALNSMAVYLIALDQHDEAEERAQHTLRLACEWSLGAYVAWSLHHLAATAALRPYAESVSAQTARERAARILGYVDAGLAAMGSMNLHIQRQEHDRALAALRDAMGPEAVANLMAIGALMTEEQALEEASSSSEIKASPHSC
jgi:tetratricopeptide (TPR) repeat protein